MKRTIFSSILMISFLVSCSTVPLTGRRQLSLIPDSQINALSFQNYQQVLQESQVVTGTEDARLVKSVGEKIAYSVEKYMAEKGLSKEIEGFKWEFNLIQEDIVNAWCM
ncbi:MAG: M48 family peptidase, partial [Bacteroidota bacterium]